MVKPDPSRDLETTLTTASGVRIVVREPEPEPDEADDREPLDDEPLALVLPDGQPDPERDAFLKAANRKWGRYIEAVMIHREMVVPESAKDLRQRVLLVLWRFHEREGKGPEHMWSYLESVIPNVVSAHKRDRSRTPQIEQGADVDASVAEVPDPEHAARVAQQKELLARWISELPPDERAAFQAVETRGLTFEKAAQELGTSHTTVYGRHGRALKKLQAAARRAG